MGSNSRPSEQVVAPVESTQPSNTTDNHNNSLAAPEEDPTSSREPRVRPTLSDAIQSRKVEHALSEAHSAVQAEPSLQTAAWSTAARQEHFASMRCRGMPQQQQEGVTVCAIQESSWIMRIWCFLIALALCATTVLGIMNFEDAAFKPYQYLFAGYNVLFAVVMCIIEGKPEWYLRCGNIQARLFAAAAFLASRAGRGTLYFYMGSMNLFMLPEAFIWRIIYVGLGGALCLSSVLITLQRCSCCSSPLARMQGP